MRGKESQMRYEFRINGADFLVIGTVYSVKMDDDTFHAWNEDLEVFEAAQNGSWSKTPLEDRELAAWDQEYGELTASLVCSASPEKRRFKVNT